MKNLEELKKLRAETSASVSACKEALEEAAGDYNKAKEIIKRKGQEIAAKKAGRESAEGLVGTYVHSNGKMGVIVKVYCETDFVARSEDFKNFVHDVALQIAAASPKYIRLEDIPAEELAAEKAKIAAELEGVKKPAEIKEKIIAGKLKKISEEMTLMGKPLVKNPEQTLSDALAQLTVKLQEKIVISEFKRFEI